MVDLPKKKVGIVACSGEELPEGTVTRLAALKVLEQLRPADTVTICLPLFLAGGEGDRAFARFYPTIAVDGCQLRCAARATEQYSGKPAASLVVSELADEHRSGPIQGARRLNPAGQQAVEFTAQRIAEQVDELSGKHWNRRSGEFVEAAPETHPPAKDAPDPEPAVQATCSCGSGIPIQKVFIDGRLVTLAGMQLIFQHFRENDRLPGEDIRRELFDTVKIYNPIPFGEEEAYSQAILREYRAFCEKEPIQ